MRSGRRYVRSGEEVCEVRGGGYVRSGEGVCEVRGDMGGQREEVCGLTHSKCLDDGTSTL